MDGDDPTRAGSSRLRPSSSALRELRTVVSTPVSIRGLVMVGVGAVLLLSPEITTSLVLVIVVGLVGAASLTDLVYAVTGRRRIRGRTRRWAAAIRGLAGIALAAVLVFLAIATTASVTLTLVVGLGGVYVGVRGLIMIVGAWTRRREHSPAGAVATGAILAAIGALGFLVPTSLLNALILLIATLSVVAGLVLIAWTLRWAHGATSLDPVGVSTAAVVWDWIRLADVGRAGRTTLAESLYFEAPEKLMKLATWWVMLVLSVAIATFAVLADSTAVVIGTMLVAPLMTPIIGLAGALVNGWQRRALGSAALVASGALVAILISLPSPGGLPSPSRSTPTPRSRRA